MNPLKEHYTVQDIQNALESMNYVSDHSISMSLFLALKLNKPLLIEGEPGSGKTEIAKVVSKIFETELIRMQCYEGLDSSTVIYEWDYLRQLLKIRLSEKSKGSVELESEIFSDKYLLKRPLLKSLIHKGSVPPVLLIDEIDRAEEEFEGFLLEFLAEFQVTIPEIGTIKAKKPPIVIITSNRTRELGDGLRRRCLYLYLDYPSLEKELKIVNLKTPNIENELALQISRFLRKLRQYDDIIKKPGISETLDWSDALLSLKKKKLDNKIVMETLGCIIKSPDDINKIDDSRVNDILKSIIS